jgi:hypothetical protein
MSVRLVIDMNLSVEWVAELAGAGWSAVHWSTVGDPRALCGIVQRHSQVVDTHGHRAFRSHRPAMDNNALAVVVTIAFSGLGVLGDYFLQLASAHATPYPWCCC